MAKLRDVDAAYLSGFFDGEGSVGAGITRGRVTAWIQITQKSPAVLNELQRLTRIGSVTRMRKPPRELWAWRIYARSDVAAFGEVVLPWTRIKRDQVVLAVELCQCDSAGQRAFAIRDALMGVR